jgi:hypothetical protein
VDIDSTISKIEKLIKELNREALILMQIALSETQPEVINSNASFQ